MGNAIVLKSGQCSKLISKQQICNERIAYFLLFCCCRRHPQQPGGHHEGIHSLSQPDSLVGTFPLKPSLVGIPYKFVGWLVLVQKL